jgi:hypothetical protein
MKVLYSQKPTSDPCAKSVESSAHTQVPLGCILVLTTRLYLSCQNGLLLSDCPTKILYACAPSPYEGVFRIWFFLAKCHFAVRERETPAALRVYLLFSFKFKGKIVLVLI